MKKRTEFVGNGEYEVAEHQQFVDRSGQLVRVVRGKGVVPVGEAYAFFNCNADCSKIQETLPAIRSALQTPSELELTLTEGVNPSTFIDERLKKIALDALDASMNYVLSANYPGADNEKTAHGLADVVNQIYQSDLYREGEQFRGAIVYKEGDNYQFIE